MRGASEPDFCVNIFGMSDECKSDERAAERAGDEYYRAVSDMVAEGNGWNGKKKKVFFLARTYHKALDFLHRCLERVRYRPDARRKLKHTVDLQGLVEQDMRILGGSTAPLASPADES